MSADPQPSPPNASKSRSTAGGLIASLSAVYRELVIIILTLVILATGVWTTVIGKSRQELEKSMLREARLRFQMGHLTQPAGVNAFELYLDTLEKFPKSQDAQIGIQSLAERYLELIERSIRWHDLRIARETLDTADTLKPWLEGTPLIDKLVASRRALQQLEQDMADRRKRLPSTAVREFEPYEVFQDRLKDGNPGPNMVFIPGGNYLMGAYHDEPGSDPDEGPQVEVNVLPFAIGQTEVTFAEYDTFAVETGRNPPDDYGWGRADRPVINVSWVDARDYAQWLSEETGFVYRLPTEAEWEYAARAGTVTPYSTGACLHFGEANVDDREFNTFAGCPSTGKFRGGTVPVTAFPPNPWGLYNVHDNVREWTMDCWLNSYEGRPTDSAARYLADGGSCGPAAARAMRGGVWNEGIRSARSANRYAQAEHRKDTGVGFRLARDIQ